jgi:hypothetical protein
LGGCSHDLLDSGDHVSDSFLDAVVSALSDGLVRGDPVRREKVFYDEYRPDHAL